MHHAVEQNEKIVLNLVHTAIEQYHIVLNLIQINYPFRFREPLNKNIVILMDYVVIYL